MAGNTTKEVLKKYWGYDALREGQGEIIDAIAKGLDVFAILPTGGGKSLCFQLPALLSEGIYLVVSPLVALIKDQVDELNEKSIVAKYLIAGQSIPHWRQIKGLKFIYISPERVQSQAFLLSIKDLKIKAIVADEAHCISQWGHDFRPNYLKINTIYTYFPKAQRLAFTATATPKVCEDIEHYFELRDPYTQKNGVERKNLRYLIIHTQDKIGTIKRYIKEEKGSILIYTNTRKSCLELARYIYPFEKKISFYHAGLNMKERTYRQAQWMHGNTRVIVATNAFGMGINKKDIRLVIHWTYSNSLEAYCQEAGRAGRDQKACSACIMVSKSDFSKTEKSLALRSPNVKTIKDVFQAFADTKKIAINTQPDVPLPIDIDLIAKRLSMGRTKVFYALKSLEYLGYIKLSDRVQEKSILSITNTREELYIFQISNPKYDSILTALLRAYGGDLFFDGIAINENEIANIAGIPQNQVIKDLKVFHDLGLMNYSQKNSDLKAYFLMPRPAISNMHIDIKALELKRQRDEENLLKMIDYVTNDTLCRQVFISRYFGYDNTKPCGICDICTHSDDTKKIDEEHILTLIKKGHYTPKSLLDKIPVEQTQNIKHILNLLTSKSKIQLDDEGYLYIK